MKANRTILMKKDDRAQVGIGTMIVFIATILVAATAAAVLIDTSGKLQERSSATGEQATKQVASNLIVKAITGGRSTTSSDIDWINITIALAPGADKVDLEQLNVTLSDGSAHQTFGYSATNAENRFTLDSLRDEDTSGNVMTSGDLVNIQIDLKLISSSVAERTEVVLTLLPEVGSPADASFTTPESFGTDTEIWLR